MNERPVSPPSARPPPLSPSAVQSLPEPQGFWRRWIAYRRQNRLAKIQHGVHPNPNRLLTVLLVILAVAFLGSLTYAVIVIAQVAHTFQSFGNNAEGVLSKTGDVISAHPELGMALLQEKPEVIMATLAKQASADAAVDGSFTSHFTTRTDRSLEKQDLTCIDQYSYLTLSVNATSYWESKERLNDLGCTDYHEDPAVTYNATIYDPKTGEPTNHTWTDPAVEYYKCPVHNCAMVEKDRTMSDQMIPDRLDISTVHASFDGRPAK